jgi:hypothetical protein
MDCGGAAAMLAAFRAAVLAGGLRRPLHCVLCLAENAIGPGAFRNDDILHIYSGKTVEINNTDAEGRLVLADGVAYACKHLSPGLIVDLATLTGAPLVATGSAERTVRLFDVAARPLGAVKYAPAFMAPRAMPVACLAFSPTEALLCAGGGDGGAALYAQPEPRRGSRDEHAYAYAAA